MYYVDRFEGEVVKHKEIFAPPERYYEYRRGTEDGIVVETYIASYDPLKLIDYAHITSDQPGYDLSVITRERDEFLKENNVSINAVLYAYTVPPAWFDKEVENID